MSTDEATESAMAPDPKDGLAAPFCLFTCPHLKSEYAADFRRVGLARFASGAGPLKDGRHAGGAGQAIEFQGVPAGEDGLTEFAKQRRQQFGQDQTAAVAGVRTGGAARRGAKGRDRQAEAGVGAAV